MESARCRSSCMQSSTSCWRSPRGKGPVRNAWGTRNLCPGASVRCFEFSTMIEMFRVLLGLCVLAPLLFPADPAKKSALDKPTLEAYVRHLFVFAPQIKLQISDPKPADVPGFQQVNVHAYNENASED